MEHINLMPLDRRLAQRQRRRRARWCSACGIYASIALALAPVLNQAGAEGRDLAAQRVRLERDVKAAAEANAQLAREREDLMRQSRLTLELQGGAQWGRLLDAVAATIGARVALERIALAPSKGDPRGYTLEITGVAVGQQAVNETALSLKRLSVEGEPLFAAVTIEGSGRRPLGSTAAVGFVLKCTLAEAMQEDE